jgi:hypothetical protein
MIAPEDTAPEPTTVVSSFVIRFIQQVCSRAVDEGQAQRISFCTLGQGSGQPCQPVWVPRPQSHRHMGAAQCLSRLFEQRMSPPGDATLPQVAPGANSHGQNAGSSGFCV